MRKTVWISLSIFFLFMACKQDANKESIMSSNAEKIKLMTLDPGHFHAALIQKSMYEEIDPEVHVFAPEGPEVLDFLQKIDQYNSREESPTEWKVTTYLGDDYLSEMIKKRPGNVMVVAGKNSQKIDYVLEAVKAGLNVYADKPLVIDKVGYAKLEEAFKVARKNNVLIYDIMTERFEGHCTWETYIASRLHK